MRGNEYGGDPAADDTESTGDPNAKYFQQNENDGFLDGFGTTIGSCRSQIYPKVKTKDGKPD